MDWRNFSGTSQNDRFKKAVIVVIPSALIMGIVFGYLRRVLIGSVGMGFTLVLVGAGYLMGILIRKIGRGVQERFSILAAVLTVVVILVSNIISMGFPIFHIFNPMSYLVVLRLILGTDIFGIITLINYVLAVSLAYQNARVVS